MKKIWVITFIFMLGVFIIAGLDYSDSNDTRAETELSPATHAQAESNIGVNTPAVSKPTTNKPETPPDTSLSPKSIYSIDVSVGEQKVRIFENSNLIKEWVVSTGKNNSTPLGKFKIQNRGDWFFSQKYQQGAMWWVSFKDWGVYLFHSVPMDNARSIIIDEANKLGTPASHGCVRLEVEDARWIYDNIPQDTEVYIHN